MLITSRCLPLFKVAFINFKDVFPFIVSWLHVVIALIVLIIRFDSLTVVDKLLFNAWQSETSSACVNISVICSSKCHSRQISGRRTLHLTIFTSHTVFCTFLRRCAPAVHFRVQVGKDQCLDLGRMSTVAGSCEHFSPLLLKSNQAQHPKRCFCW